MDNINRSQTKLDPFFPRIQKLSERDKVALLSYLCGWCGNDEEFVDGVQRFLAATPQEQAVSRG